MTSTKTNNVSPPWEQTGDVSLWIGLIDNQSHFDEIVRVHISNGEYLGSRFTKGFGIEFYDEGFQEAEFRAPPTSDIERLLAGVSYSNIITPRLQKQAAPGINANCFILLYNYHHIGAQFWSEHGAELRFYGTVSYLP